MREQNLVVAVSTDVLTPGAKLSTGKFRDILFDISLDIHIFSLILGMINFQNSRNDIARTCI